jgi:dihydroorotate dehydrogenase electron transfer subunit
MVESAFAERQGALPRQVRITAIRQENYRTRTFELDLSLPGAVPGQFVMVWLPGLDEKPFSIAGADPLTLTIANVGPFSSALHQLQVGATVGVRGPFGNGFQILPGPALLAGGGYGVAPLGFLAQRILAQSQPVTVLIGARTQTDLLLAGQIGALGANVIVSTEDGSAGELGLLTGPARRILQQNNVGCLYGCGPHGMLEALTLLAAEFHCPAQMSWEAFMRCGMGVCGSCEHDGQLVCRDGPVRRS